MFKKLATTLLLLVYGFSFLNAQDNPVHWKFSSKKITDCEYDLVFTATIDEPWHVYSLNKLSDDGPMPTVFNFTKSKDYQLSGKTQQSTPVKEFDKVFEVNVEYFKHTATFTQRVKLLANKKITISGKYEFQACTEEKCIFPPADEFSFDLNGTPSCVSSTGAATVVATASVAAIETSENPSECACDTQAIVAAKTGVTSTTNTSNIPANQNKEEVKAAPKNVSEGECNAWEKFFLGLGAGLGAVLMPCIYSLIPLTVSFFIKRSKTRAIGIKNSILYGFFIIITFVIPTMLITIIFGPSTLSQIATNTWLNLFFFLLFVVFALSFFGLFEITLPSSWSNKLDKNADKGGALGIFFMAATLVVVSFSCTAGFLGPLLTALAEGNSYLCPFAGFTGFGTGIALPFMLFAFFPSMLNSLPKSGGWMTTFKVTVAFIELALAIKFLANADNVNEWGFITREVFISLWIGIFGMMTLYLLGVFKTSHDTDSKHLSVGRILFATISLTFTIYLIPGLWGAPLKIISSFPPPHYYSESPDGIGGNHSSNNKNNSDSDEAAELEKKMISGPDGLRIFKDDYETALKYSKLVNKPLFIDFTGLACVNCRLMESSIWVKPEVFKLLKDSVVIVSLYVDSKVDLPEKEQKEVFWYGKNRTLSTVGDKWAYFQTTTYKTSSQPMYVVVDSEGKMLSNGTMGTELDELIFKNWLSGSINTFKKH
ncbi:MAG: thioredoxin family protein [Bacteroidetes bacterium]|nr:thioredoxin family protein [Bacteroidota bacterium]